MLERAIRNAWRKLYVFCGGRPVNKREDILAIALSKALERIDSLENASSTVVEHHHYTVGVDPALPVPPKLSDSTGDPPRLSPYAIESTQGDAKS
ncbi:MAG: hypothetical protein ACW99U_12605 [Candidatus Thorarchaeota archaeon]